MKTKYFKITFFILLFSALKLSAQEEPVSSDAGGLVSLNPATSALLDSVLKTQPFTYSVRRDQKTKDGVLEEEKLFVIAAEDSDTLLTLSYQSCYKKVRLGYYYGRFIRKEDVWYLQKTKNSSLCGFPKTASLSDLIRYFAVQDL